MNQVKPSLTCIRALLKLVFFECPNLVLHFCQTKVGVVGCVINGKSASSKVSPVATFSFHDLSSTTHQQQPMAATRNILVSGPVGPWPQFGLECNDENLVTVSGLNQENLEFDDDRVSETGLLDQPRQIVRATEGNDATNELLDWDGKRWAPIPADWENDRTSFNDAFVPNYIREWEQTVPAGTAVTLSINNDYFESGKAVVDNDVLIVPLSQPDIIQSKSKLLFPLLPLFSPSSSPHSCFFFSNTCLMLSHLHLHHHLYLILTTISTPSSSSSSPHLLAFSWPCPDPNTTESDRVTKPLTSDLAISNAISKAKSIKTNKKLAQASNKQNQQEIAVYVPEANPFAPAMDMYLRPAEEKDAQGIAYVYNMAIETSNVPEDQLHVTVDQVAWLIDDSKGKAPFIVAVYGPCPEVHTQDAEYILGFARAESFDYGMSGNMNGRSRGTANLHIYVEPQFQRKRIGYNLMDRMLHMITPSYAYMEGVKWVNPTRSKFDEVSGGFGLWHQLLFKVAVHKQDDEAYRGLKNFLFGKFFFKETARLPSAARSRCSTNEAKFMDLIFFQREASAAAEFEPYMWSSSSPTSSALPPISSSSI